MVRILAGDPGRTNDAFGFVGIEYTGEHRRVKFARQYRGKFADTARMMIPHLERIKPDYFALEANNQGIHACRAFEKIGWPPIHVITAGSITKRDYRVMDKPDTVHWLRQSIKAGLVLFPDKASKDIEALIQQINQYTGYVSLTGNMTYKAKSGHDDLVSALLIACHVSRICT